MTDGFKMKGTGMDSLETGIGTKVYDAPEGQKVR